MFKEYKELFKNLGEMQDQLWAESMASFPASALPKNLSEWQQQTFEGVNSLVGQAVRHSLELQSEWLNQWKERAGSNKLKPKRFSELSTEAMNSTQRWLENQNQLWDQWLQVLRATGRLGDRPDLEVWEKAIQQSVQQQMDLLDDWSDMADFEKLSVKEATKLSDKIVEAMEKSIETQDRLWSHWLNELLSPEPETDPSVATKPRRKQTSTAIKKKRSPGATSQSSDNLKQISGIGPALEKKLKANGISTFKQLAELSKEDIARLEEQVIRFPGRIGRERWVQQAKKLIP